MNTQNKNSLRITMRNRNVKNNSALSNYSKLVAPPIASPQSFGVQGQMLMDKTGLKRLSEKRGSEVNIKRSPYKLFNLDQETDKQNEDLKLKKV